MTGLVKVGWDCN
jgi:hypothetical protein